MFTKSRIPGWHWVLQRVSGLMLAVGMIGHFLVLHYTPLFTDGGVKTYESTADRFGNGGFFWFLFDAMILMAAVYHGLQGTYNIIVDYNPKSSTRKTLAWFLWILGVATCILGFVLLGKFIGEYKTAL